MRIFKIITLLISVLVVSLFLVDNNQSKKIANNSPYKETDWWGYYIYKDKDINPPRLSGKYYFTYVEEEGSRPQSSTIIFSNVKEVAPLYAWLKDMAFQKEKANSRDEVWTKSGDFQTAFHLYFDPAEQEVVFSKTHFSG